MLDLFGEIFCVTHTSFNPNATEAHSLEAGPNLKEVRAEYREHRKDKVFAKCWPSNNDSFYEWCSQYIDYQHITKKKR